LPPPPPKRSAALELSGRLLPVTRLRVLDPDRAAIDAQIEALVRQMPRAVKGMAVVIDGGAEAVDLDLGALLARLREAGIQPLGVADGPLADAARRAGIAVLAKDAGKAESAPARAPVEPPAEPAPAQGTRMPAQVVTGPVRSGQQIYAEGCDLIVLNTVSPGAEVIADGCVHVYGTLRGRAMAGARGDATARIFCRKMEAELIAIAGIYAVAEQIKEGPRGQPAQAWLEQGRLRIEPHKI